MNNEKVGKFIASLRKSKNLTQQQLGDMVGVGGKSVSKWERGINMPDISIINEVSKILGVTTNELLNGEFDKKSSNEQYRKNKKKKIFRIFLISLIILIIFLCITLFIRNDNKIYRYNLYSSDDRFTVEGNIEYDKKSYSIEINKIYCKVNECKDIYVSDLICSLTLNNNLVYKYSKKDNDGAPILMNNYLSNKEIQFSSDYMGLITYESFNTNQVKIFLDIDGSNQNDVAFSYKINLEIADK